MPDAIDVYADQLGLNIGPFGCALNFSVSAPLPPPGGGAVPGQPVATVRMSLEHLKTMAFLLRRQLVQYERGAGIQIPVPQDVLNQLRIGREDWNECWGGDGR
ncbi:MAG: hypothetical protein HY614_04045 [Candidatus Rokubacteria bacterium]|nr:hypothetical protein [Candidatus Rokubacteria bacterium]